jgi:hypothetical protein
LRTPNDRSWFLPVFDELISRIETHDKYGPAMREAAAAGAAIILNYHTHGGPTGYCVSLCRRKSGGLPVLGQPEPLEELAHIRGVGRTEQECRPLMTLFGDRLRAHYGLSAPPLIYLNGKPVPPQPGEAKA